MTADNQPLDASQPFLAYSSQVADLLERAGTWRMNTGSRADLDQALTDAAAGLACHDADAMFRAAITLGGLAEEYERFGGRTDKSDPSEPAEDFPHLRVNELVHRLRTHGSPTPVTPPAPDAATKNPHR